MNTHRTHGLRSLLARVIDQRTAFRIRPGLVGVAYPCHVWAKLFAGHVSIGGLLDSRATFLRNRTRSADPLIDRCRRDGKVLGQRPLAADVFACAFDWRVHDDQYSRAKDSCQ